MAFALLPEDWPDETDEEVGKKLLQWFIGLLAETAGLPVDQIPQYFQDAAIQDIIPNLEAQTAEDAAWVLALQKAVRGDLQSAGRIFREYMVAGAKPISTTRYANNTTKYAKLGIDWLRQQQKAGFGGHKEDQEKHKTWRRLQKEEAANNPKFAKKTKQAQAAYLKKIHSIEEQVGTIAKRLLPASKKK